VLGAPLARDAVVIGAGIDLAFDRRATLGIAYTGTIASNCRRSVAARHPHYPLLKAPSRIITARTLSSRAKCAP
jgi:hypothetical protein